MQAHLTVGNGVLFAFRCVGILFIPSQAKPPAFFAAELTKTATSFNWDSVNDF